MASPVQAFSVLLASLDVDRDRAGEEYERLRHKLILFFASRGSAGPAEDLADRALDAVARRLQQGVQIYARDISSYCYGVAQNILRDYRKSDRSAPLTRDPAVSPTTSTDQERELECLEKCLQELPPESRYLIQSYYKDERRAKIDHRQQIAGQLGITPNALRLRAHQIRLRLEKCVKSCSDGA